MSYTALYRKFRPLTFNEMVGQEHIIKTLKNQLISGRVGHAYLFNGGRGTGKTTTAKIFARALNCLHPNNGEPCNECEICKASISGSLTDIVEMDAASNNGVEDIRSIREEVNFLPTLAKYRVYIIDEVHMLSISAFNALLKTLEEPPEHVKFILATTEPQKIPSTIVSRCQRFDFKTVSIEDIVSRLSIIASESNITITPDALRTIAVLAEGGMRDAISILERCTQDGENEISEDKVKDLVGIPKLEYINKIVNNIAEHNPTDALITINDIINEGKDLDNFLWEIIKYIKDILIYQTCKDLKLYNNSEIEQIKDLSNSISKNRLLTLIYELSELSDSIKWSSQKQIVFQAGIIKVCMEPKNTQPVQLNTNESSNTNTLSPTITLEKQTTSKPVTSNIENTNIASTKKKVTSVASTSSEAVPYWSNVLNKLKQEGNMTLYVNLMNSVARELNDMTIGVEFPNGLTAFGKTVFKQPENMKELEKLVSIEAGKEMKIKFIDLNEISNSKQENDNNNLADLGIPINIIDA